MKTFIVIIVCLSAFNILAQEPKNKVLKQQLDSIYYKDQKLREIYMGDVSGDEKIAVLKNFGYTIEEFDARTWPIINRQDSLNLIEVERIIEMFGYPGKTMVGEPTNKAVWYVIQHSDKIEQYFSIIQKAGENGELPKRLVAMMQDRMLMGQEKEQIYGTQIAGRQINIDNLETPEWFNFVWPVKDPETVNERRRKAGFKTSVEENAQHLDVDYQVFTLKQIDSILNPK